MFKNSVFFYSVAMIYLLIWTFLMSRIMLSSLTIGIICEVGFRILIELDFLSAVTITFIFLGKYFGNQKDTFASLDRSDMSLKLSIPSNMSITYWIICLIIILLPYHTLLLCH